MKKKKLLTIFTFLSISMLLTACESKTDSTDGTAESSSSAKASSSSSTAEAVDLNSLELPQLSSEVAENEDLVEMTTSLGTIKIKLFPKIAPLAVENFMTHAKEGYYNGVTFHRVISEFMIQGGDPDGTGAGGESIWKEEFAPEISDQLYHIRGALAMARTGGDVSKKTQGSQFYIVQNDEDVSSGLSTKKYPEKIINAYKNGGTPSLDGQYSVFGQVIEGLDVVDKIAASATDSNNKPTTDITIESINILQEAK